MAQYRIVNGKMVGICPWCEMPVDEEVDDIPVPTSMDIKHYHRECASRLIYDLLPARPTEDIAEEVPNSGEKTKALKALKALENISPEAAELLNLLGPKKSTSESVLREQFKGDYDRTRAELLSAGLIGSVGKPFYGISKVLLVHYLALEKKHLLES